MIGADLYDAIELLLEKSLPSTLKKGSQALSKAYAQGHGSKVVFREESERLAYLAARMPATYGACLQALQSLPVTASKWLDLGAGPGTASWAAVALFPDAKGFTLIEKSKQAIDLGLRLAENHPVLSRAEWIHADLPKNDLPAADAAILSYSLGEMKESARLIESWWRAEIPWLVVVEPGTPRGFSCIAKARDQVIALGGRLAAPCPHLLKCPMKENQWCHFAARIPRTRLHRYLKEGSLGYEDEKFSYLIAAKPDHFSLSSSFSRIVRTPQKNSGHVCLSLCNPSGSLEQVTIGRSHALYRSARDASWGGAWPESP